jgi:hypothetical protein
LVDDQTRSFFIFRKHQQCIEPRIQQHHEIIAAGVLYLACPRKNFLFRAAVVSVLDVPFYGCRKHLVPVKDLPVPQPFFAPPFNLIDLQIRYGGKLLLYSGAIILLIVLESEITAGKNAYCQEAEYQEKNVTGSGVSFFRIIHSDDPLQ